MNNLELFRFCLDNKENYVDKCYEKESIIITNLPSIENKLMKANREILKNISAYEIARNDNNQVMISNILDNIEQLLHTPGINNSEFTNFWGIFDISYSGYQALESFEKKEFLKEILEKYIDYRHNMYLNHGYTATTLQVRMDSVAHKRSGGLGGRKVESILNSRNIGKYNNGGTLQGFLDSEKSYILPDGDGKQIFIDFLTSFQTVFTWHFKHQNKFPDFLIKIKDRFFIMEHKHMKEGGGGQNKQIVEIIDFVNYSDKGISYVSFLDGVYFNRFSAIHSNKKTQAQYNGIFEALTNNSNNYFVNTAGFVKLIESL